MTIKPALMLLGLSLVASQPTVVTGRTAAAIVSSPIADRFGHVAFINSGSQAAQRDFLDGLALLHDFEYDAARSAFQRAEAIDPLFVMAYWGEAMTFNAPVWQLRYADKARLALAKLAPNARGA